MQWLISQWRKKTHKKGDSRWKKEMWEYRWRDRKIERWEIFSFILSFVLEIYNLYFSIFQDFYVVLLLNLSGINFNFSIFQELVNQFDSYDLILLLEFDFFFSFLIFCILGYNEIFLMHSIDQ